MFTLHECGDFIHMICLDKRTSATHLTLCSKIGYDGCQTDEILFDTFLRELCNSDEI